jgi:hypothetical protein
VVYEATQAGLERRVALKLFPSGRGLGEGSHWPEHPNIVSLYAAGSQPDGSFVAMQLVRGGTLAELRTANRLQGAHLLDVLTGIASALDAAHGLGVAHGDLKEENVLIGEDGRAFLSDFGMSSEPATAPADRAAFRRMTEACLGVDVSGPDASTAREIVELAAKRLPAEAFGDPAAGRNRWWIGAVVGGLALATAIVVITAGGDGGQEGPPPVPEGAVPLGSTLSAPDPASVDCQGNIPSGASFGCTLVQTGLPRSTVAAGRSGVIRQWTVRGAKGGLSLEVVRRRGNAYASKARTTIVSVPDTGFHSYPASLPIRKGDLVGLEVSPGAAVGVRERVPGATTARWFGPLTATARPIDRGPRTGFDHEVLLRVDYSPGAQLRLGGLLTGRKARSAPAGTLVGSRDVELSGGTVRTVAVVRVGNRVAFDLFRGATRLIRVTVAGAEPQGRLANLNVGRRPTVQVDWQNPGGQIVTHEYGIRSDSLSLRQ